MKIILANWIEKYLLIDCSEIDIEDWIAGVMTAIAIFLGFIGGLNLLGFFVKF